MKIKTLEIAGIKTAMHAMRNPMDSWAKGDSSSEVGPKDKELSIKLQKAGPEHCKHLRMVMVWADISAPRYWWTEFDTYRAGVEKVSCSTMHKLASKPIQPDDFECDAGSFMIDAMCVHLNSLIDSYNTAPNQVEKKEAWRSLIQCLPQSYIQMRTVMMSYAALRNIVRQREGHKLKEWAAFIDWVKTLPENWMIFE